MSVSPTGREEGDIQAILQDSGFEEDADLRRSLEDLRAFALDGPPEPRADLQALLAPGIASLDLRRRNRQRRMGIVVGAAVIGAMGLGAGAVAASGEDFRRSVSHAVVKILEPISQTPASNTDAPPPSPSDVAVPPAPSPAAVTPSASASKSARPAPASATPAPGNAAADHGGSQAKTPAVPLRPTTVPATPVPAPPGASSRPFAGLLPLLHTVPGPVPGKP
ncbi:hypothetical protein ASG92_06460 [Arthrobacter sp. Soil736]|uniref:hypothetical protein n=1 Tax=Arthrobacter sp. Soil736 TaxID=1736395 RepID=UPI0006FCAEE0|nr:hypothetical protein [Arthrobacter sp. Soil736]KRE53179.1 hypothetical protein ASG92_06460 [Arthrobacter sp. Soil736]